MLTFAKLSLHEENFVCQFFIGFCTSLRMLSDTCTSLRLSSIQEWGTIYKPSYNQPMPSPDLHFSSNSQTVSYQLIINLWFLYFFSHIVCFSWQGIIQKNSASVSWMLPFVIFNKKVSYCQK